VSFLINMTTAELLQLTIPPSLAALADEVIEWNATTATFKKGESVTQVAVPRTLLSCAHLHAHTRLTLLRNWRIDSSPARRVRYAVRVGRGLTHQRFSLTILSQ
jgi:hypothetical protein